MTCAVCGKDTPQKEYYLLPAIIWDKGKPVNLVACSKECKSIWIERRKNVKED